MAAVTMTMAVAGARFAAATARAEASFTRNGASLSLAAPVGGATSISTSMFPEFGKGGFRSGLNAAIVARASDLEQGNEVATQEVEAEAEAAPAAVQPGTKLYVGNLPWSIDSAQLAEICQDYGTVEAVDVIYEAESGRSRGFAFVTMASNADAEAVIGALHGADVGGRALRVNYPQPKGARPEFEKVERRPWGDRRRDDNPNKLFVGNLTWGCDDNALHQLFSDYGKVVEARVVKDRETNRSKGYGFVTLENASDVNSCIEKLDGADFEGRQLRVNMAGDKPPRREP